MTWSCWLALRMPLTATRQCHFGLVPFFLGSYVLLSKAWLGSECLTSSNVCSLVSLRMNRESQANSDGRGLNQTRFPVQTLGQRLSHFKFHPSILACLHSKEPVVIKVLILELGPGRLEDGKYWHRLPEFSLQAVALSPLLCWCEPAEGPGWSPWALVSFWTWLMECFLECYGICFFIKGRTNK